MVKTAESSSEVLLLSAGIVLLSARSSPVSPRASVVLYDESKLARSPSSAISSFISKGSVHPTGPWRRLERVHFGGRSALPRRKQATQMNLSAVA